MGELATVWSMSCVWYLSHLEWRVCEEVVCGLLTKQVSPQFAHRQRLRYSQVCGGVEHCHGSCICGRCGPAMQGMRAREAAGCSTCIRRCVSGRWRAAVAVAGAGKTPLLTDGCKRQIYPTSVSSRLLSGKSKRERGFRSTVNDVQSIWRFKEMKQYSAELLFICKAPNMNCSYVQSIRILVVKKTGAYFTMIWAPLARCWAHMLA
jgi:hypothetical protein